MRRGLVAAALLLAPGARALQSNVGTAAAQFLTIGAGARSLGMGGAYTAIAEGPEAIYWNPAGLAAMKAPEADYSITQLPAGITHNYAAAAAPSSLLDGDIGVAFTSLTQPGLDLVTASNQTVGSFAPHSEAYALSYAHRFVLGGAGASSDSPNLDREWILPGAERPLGDDAGSGPLVAGILDAGIAVKYIDENLGTRAASTFAVDAGATFRPTAVNDLILGAAVRNLGGKLNYIDTPEPLPTEVGVSAAYAILGEGWRLLPALDVSLPYAGNPYAKLGVEFSRALGAQTWGDVRLGYTSQPAVDLGAVAGLTAGIGLRVNRFLFDAAFEPMSYLGDEYRISAGWRF
ncbi:MAG: hypothetical protein HKL90_01360 [Elusimicrobia bacterium]|nr:hypothetical protein [Elusimicrobiota bacterium]